MSSRTDPLASLVCSSSRVHVKDSASVQSLGFPKIVAMKLSCLDSEFSGTWINERSQLHLLANILILCDRSEELKRLSL